MITGGLEGPHHHDQSTDTAWLFINNSPCSIEYQFEINLPGADQLQFAVYEFKADWIMFTATSYTTATSNSVPKQNRRPHQLADSARFSERT
jgi:hypothetical protein